MIRIHRTLVTVLALGLGAAVVAGSPTAARASAAASIVTEKVSLELFEQELSPHGSWIVIEHYGRVWRPAARVVGTTFVPYSTAGHWTYTEDGWEWDSDYDWGWATFHYGRWLRDVDHGWVWVPGYTWAPAWVEWRIGETYVGWVPTPPHGVRIIQTYWTFVETRHFTQRRVLAYAVAPRYVAIVYPRTRVHEVFVSRGSVVWHGGPPVVVVSRAAGVAIRPLPRRPAVPVRVRMRFHAHGRV